MNNNFVSISLAALILAAGVNAEEASTEASSVVFETGDCFTDSLIISGTDTTWNPEYKAIQFKMVNDTTRVACIDGMSRARLQTIDIPTAVAVDSVAYNRVFSNAYSTIVLPFDGYIYGNIYDANFLKFVGLKKYWDGGEWIVDAQQVQGGILQANTPYIVYTNTNGKSNCTITFTKHQGTNVDFVLKTSTENLTTVVPSTDSAYASEWEFRGTYEYKKWNESNNASELGRVYGLASKNIKKADGSDSIKAGDFVKGASGVSVAPMKAYLYYNKVAALAKSAADSTSDIPDEDLPDVITLRILDEEGNVMSISQLSTHSGQVVMDKNLWFDLKGRKFNRKPTVKGTYYNQGKKVIIK